MQPSIFTKIVAGDIPCHRVYDDEHVMAILDINPLTTGHTLVFPKEQAEHLHDLSSDAAAALGRALPRICKAVVEVTGIENYNILQNNGRLAHQAVPHVHFHIIPKTSVESGLVIQWPTGQLNDDEGAALAARIEQSIV